ncbi:MAG TPA: hypothetical protein V6D19_04530 [Stenomitos sp.]
MTKTSDALKILDALCAKDGEIAQMVRKASLNARFEQIIYAARSQAGLNDLQLAD